jgi:hypothetical protein
MASAEQNRTEQNRTEQNRFTYFLRRFKFLGLSRLESDIMKPVLFTALYPGNFYV